MIDHNGYFANPAEDNRESNNGIRNGEKPDEPAGDYYYDDATGYEPYDGEADDEGDDEEEDGRSGS